MGTGNSEQWCLLELPLGEAAETFDLEKAVCSHGLFMMSPNYWDPLSRTLSRPLRLPPVNDVDIDDDTDILAKSNINDASASVVVSIFQPQFQQGFPSLHIYVYGTCSLSAHQRHCLLGQVARMLHLWETDNRNVREFRKIVLEETRGVEDEYLRSFHGRVFRSPTLFEDMVKCVLLCNCQWPRSLSMARALCELQWELQCQSSGRSFAEVASTESRDLETEAEDFILKTPSPTESKRKQKLRVCNVSEKLMNKFKETDAVLVADLHVTIDSDQMKTQQLSSILLPKNLDDGSRDNSKSYETENETEKDNPYVLSKLHFLKRTRLDTHDGIGNFPNPRELANLDESFLAKRCNLGYRAGRILKLARGIVEGRIQLAQLEEVCKEPNPSSYDQLVEQLSEIDGFGPFTCANVLMCMGFYHVIPSDAETIRHLKQVHQRNSTIQTVQRDVEAIYGKYSPFQFLAYWAELWHFYGQKFGKLSEMPHTDYKLITGSNMRSKGSRKNKRTRTS